MKKEQQAPSSQALLARAKRAFSIRQQADAVALVTSAVKASNFHAEIVRIGVDLLNNHGERTAAFELLQQYLGAGGNDPGVYEVMAKLALDVNVPEVAQKLLSILIDIEPQEPRHYVNYCSSLFDQQKFAEAVDFLQGTVPQFPNHAPLWNQLGTLLAVHMGDPAQGYEFYKEAYRLAPDNFSIVNNIASLRAFEDDAEKWFSEAIALDPDHPTPHVGYATYLFQQGRMQEAYEHYEYRLNPGQGATRSVIYDHQRKVWRGQSLKGKSILVMAEQGLGDELFFALNFHRLCEDADEVILSCDARLVSIFKRSFPDAQVITYEDEAATSSRIRRFPEITHRLRRKGDIDYVIPAGSLMQYFWSNPDSVPEISQSILVPDPDLVRKVAERIKCGNGRLKVGVSWRSGNTKGARQSGYFPHKFYNKFGMVTNTDFFCLQYDPLPTEVRNFVPDKDLSHITYFEDIDFKDDLETTLAFMANLDVVIGPGIATQMFALLGKVPTFFVSTSGLPWWNFGQKSDGPAFAPHFRWYTLQDYWRTRDKMIDAIQAIADSKCP